MEFLKEKCLTIVRENEFDKPPVEKIDYLIDIFLKVVILKLFRHLIICVNMILNLQILVTME